MLNIYKIIRRPKYVKLLFYKKISKNLSKVLCLFYLIWQILNIYIYIYSGDVILGQWCCCLVFYQIQQKKKFRKNKTFEALSWTPMLPSALFSIVAIFIAITIVRDVKKTDKPKKLAKLSPIFSVWFWCPTKKNTDLAAAERKYIKY